LSRTKVIFDKINGLLDKALEGFSYYKGKGYGICEGILKIIGIHCINLKNIVNLEKQKL